MAFEQPSIKTIYNRMIADIESRMTGKVSLLPVALLRILAIVFAGAIHILYRFLVWLGLQLIVTTAGNEWLTKHGYMWGVTRKEATYAKGQVKFTGLNGSVIPIDTLMRNTDGFQYRTDAEVTIAGGIGYSDVTAIDVGVDYNYYVSFVGEVLDLILVSPIGDVTDEAALQGSPGEVTGGIDEEAIETYRLRIISRIQDTPAGGKKSDYIRWAEEVGEVEKAWCFPTFQGAGTVAVVIIPASETVASTVQAYIDDRKPVTANSSLGGGQYVFPVELIPIRLNMTIEPDEVSIQQTIITNIENLFKNEGEPGGKILLSHIQMAIAAAGVYNYDITYIGKDGVSMPIADIDFDNYEFPFLEEIIF